MANSIEPSGIPSVQFVTPTSRYRDSSVEYYSDRKLITFEIYKRKPFVPNQADMFMVIGQGHEYRPDLVSSKAYGMPDFWWKIMEANNMFDVFDFKAGVNIRIPAANF